MNRTLVIGSAGNVGREVLSTGGHAALFHSWSSGRIAGNRGAIARRITLGAALVPDSPGSRDGQV
jgi:hypothetical protein